MSAIGPNSPPPMPPKGPDNERDKTLKQSVKDSSHIHGTPETRTNPDWTKPETPAGILSDIFKKVLIILAASQITR